MQENSYYKPGGELSRPDPASGGLLGTPSQPGFTENNGVFGGVDWASSGIGPAVDNYALQQDTAENTALGNIIIPA